MKHGLLVVVLKIYKYQTDRTLIGIPTCQLHYAGCQTNDRRRPDRSYLLEYLHCSWSDQMRTVQRGEEEDAAAADEQLALEL